MSETRKSGNLVGYGASALVLGLVAYFAYTAIQGPYGVLSLYKIEEKEARLQAQLDGLVAERKAAQNRTRRLSDKYLDLDLLDEQARKVLGLIRGDEIIVQ